MALSESLRRFRTGEAASFIGCTPATIRVWVARGDLRCFHRPSGQLEFDISDLSALRDMVRARGPHRGRPMIGPAMAAKRAGLAAAAVQLIQQEGSRATHTSR